MLDPVVRNYLFHEFRLKLTRDKVILGALVVVFVILAFLDRERRVRSFHFLVIFTVMFITGPAAGFFNNLFGPIKLYTVGFIEEGMKILPVVLLAIYLPNLIRTRKDGIVYGALAGMGLILSKLACISPNRCTRIR